ncbi:methyltransferase domain-containing protein [Halobacillus salinarum]|uniref:Methyltransferase domain-containing protein n=1 Tax=Halobacillus salinarum TaxID=2932257 RepID=A0ABY4EL17_9BACI|nr:class I SAM-dependent methyltransferase [Halobacillus salinarum]UOQ45158.1 methyltransferase domain-containing protein [Halobacillus salinarum]
MKEKILNNQDLYQMLDSLIRKPKPFWEEFYEDRDKEIPFFQTKQPDENLVEYFHHYIKPRTALELGCGPGRNAIYMARQGCEVEAVDISENAIEWAQERAADENLQIRFRCGDIFQMNLQEDSYDFIYDSGLLHHLPPHQRMKYIAFICKVLKPKGHFGLVCFTPEGGADITDWEVYRHYSMQGGIGYEEERLKELFKKEFHFHTFRRMKKMEQSDDLFGEDFLWTSLMELRPSLDDFI